MSVYLNGQEKWKSGQCLMLQCWLEFKSGLSFIVPMYIFERDLFFFESVLEVRETEGRSRTA